MIRLLAIMAIIYSLLSCSVNPKSDTIVQTRNQVDIFVIAHSLPYKADSLVAFVYPSECAGVVGVYLKAEFGTWQVLVERIPNPVHDTTAIHRALFVTNANWIVIPDSLGNEVLQRARALDSESVAIKSRREDLEIFPITYLFYLNTNESTISKKVWFLISRQRTSDNLLKLRILTPKLFEAYYGVCTDDLPGCLVYKSMRRAIESGGAGRLGCLSPAKMP